jgi:hypothetical protein
VAPIWRYAGRASDIDSTDCGDVPNIREVEGLPAIWRVTGLRCTAALGGTALGLIKTFGPVESGRAVGTAGLSAHRSECRQPQGDLIASRHLPYSSVRRELVDRRSRPPGLPCGSSSPTLAHGSRHNCLPETGARRPVWVVRSGLQDAVSGWSTGHQVSVRESVKPGLDIRSEKLPASDLPAIRTTDEETL